MRVRTRNLGRRELEAALLIEEQVLSISRRVVHHTSLVRLDHVLRLRAQNLGQTLLQVHLRGQVQLLIRLERHHGALDPRLAAEVNLLPIAPFHCLILPRLLDRWEPLRLSLLFDVDLADLEIRVESRLWQAAASLPQPICVVAGAWCKV